MIHNNGEISSPKFVRFEMERDMSSYGVDLASSVSIFSQPPVGFG